MRLLFVILAHDQPEEAAELAATLTEAGSDARALIHFDLRADPALFARLQSAVAGAPRVGLVRDRVATPWGQWGLVEAPLRALAQAEAAAHPEIWGGPPDRAILLSGACLPCRPIRQLEAFLAARPTREFIEVEPPSWIKDGIRDERWKLRFPFNFRSQPRRHRAGVMVQRALGLKRRFPAGLTPRFGSQWWALSWKTCAAILDWRRRNPKAMAFFRDVWIPDEMTIQTLVHALAPATAPTGAGLTHFQFTDRGVPVVYHDDHHDYLHTLDAFFFRKVAPGAGRVRAAFLAMAHAPEDGPPVHLDRRAAGDYDLRIAAQTAVGGPGRPFAPDQRTDEIDRVLARGTGRIVLLFGPSAITEAVARRFPRDAFTVFGEAFAKGRVDFGDGRRNLGGLTATDVAIRDMHPALYLMRMVDRAAGTPVVRWRPGQSPRLLNALMRDPRVIFAACLPRTGDRARDLAALNQATLDPVRAARVEALADGAGPEMHARLAEALAMGRTFDEGLHWLGAGPITLDFDADATRLSLRALFVNMAWSPEGADGLGPLRAEAFERGLARLRFLDAPAAPAVAAALRAAWRDPVFTAADGAPAASPDPDLQPH